MDCFYQEISTLFPQNMEKEIGHFNVFRIEDLTNCVKKTGKMLYNRRLYYKISLIRGRNRAEYTDKVIEIEKQALLFASPKTPYHYLPLDGEQTGYFCIFTEEFLYRNQGATALELPIFQTGSFPIFQLSDEEVTEIGQIYQKMFREIASDYKYKYDLLRNYVIELAHYGQKLQPASAMYPTHNASARVSSLFIELLERQFPIESPRQRIGLRAAKDFADRLAVHVNHLNKSLKENTGKTTTEMIGARITQEAKILLRQTDWTIADVAYCLGFEEPAHFSNFFKKNAGLSPATFRA